VRLPVLVLVLIAASSFSSSSCCCAKAASFSSVYEDFFGRSPRKAGRFSAGEPREPLCFRCDHPGHCSWGDRGVLSIPAWIYLLESLWEGLVVGFAPALEVLARGFSLGFGIRMLLDLSSSFHRRHPDDDNDDDDAANNNSGGGGEAQQPAPTGKAAAARRGPGERGGEAGAKRFLRSFRRRASVAAISGASLACFLHGSSFFVPAGLREGWFVDHRHSRSTGTRPDRRRNRGRLAATATATANHHCHHPNTALPPVLFEILRDTVAATSGTSEPRSDEGCPRDCNGPEFGNPSRDEITVDWRAYGLGRIETGISCLAATVEIVLRGFLRGFGARMLLYLLAPPRDTGTDDESGGGGDGDGHSESNGGDDTNNEKDSDSNISGEDSGGESNTTESERKTKSESDPRGTDSHKTTTNNSSSNNNNNNNNNNNTTGAVLASFRYRILVSVVSGISLASFLHGSSLFVPTRLRERWLTNYDYHDHDYDDYDYGEAQQQRHQARAGTLWTTNAREAWHTRRSNSFFEDAVLVLVSGYIVSVAVVVSGFFVAVFFVVSLARAAWFLVRGCLRGIGKTKKDEQS